MENSITVKSQLWVKAFIVLGIPLLAWVGVLAIVYSVESGFVPLVDTLIYTGCGLFCIWLVFKGFPLLRFLQHSLILREEGIEIVNGSDSRFYKWDQIGGIDFNSSYQILSIYDQNNKRIYAVDYYAENFGEFMYILSGPDDEDEYEDEY